jgi:hypothetical protein
MFGRVCLVAFPSGSFCAVLKQNMTRHAWNHFQDAILILGHFWEVEHLVSVVTVNSIYTVLTTCITIFDFSSDESISSSSAHANDTGVLLCMP